MSLAGKKSLSWDTGVVENERHPWQYCAATRRRRRPACGFEAACVEARAAFASLAACREAAGALERAVVESIGGKQCS